MSIPSINQYYTVLKTLTGHPTPITAAILLTEMKDISVERWGLNSLGEVMYVHTPWPLGDLLEEMTRNGDVITTPQGAILLTAQGREELTSTELLIG